jgi:hypothetical protein
MLRSHAFRSILSACPTLLHLPPHKFKTYALKKSLRDSTQIGSSGSFLSSSREKNISEFVEHVQITLLLCMAIR